MLEEMPVNNISLFSSSIQMNHAFNQLLELFHASEISGSKFHEVGAAKD